MIIRKNKSGYECAKCRECGKTASEANLHEIEIGKDFENEVRFYLCYSCLKELEEELKSVRPEGKSAWKICENEFYEPENAKDCLHCKECIISTADGFNECFECLLEGFFFYEDEVPETKKCQKD